ncbi:hypothetical protein Tco_0655684 [Tanacetum coccineum]|uniref:Uncharacterized protein n=1 Tax=Tanacetum coccineum TaxID=301880 RepID=A0ABQ4X6N1_9ASTR
MPVHCVIFSSMYREERSLLDLEGESEKGGNWGRDAKSLWAVKSSKVLEGNGIQEDAEKYSGSLMLKNVEYVDPKGFPSLKGWGTPKRIQNSLHFFVQGNPEILLHDHCSGDSGCSSHMTGNKAYLSDYEYYNGGFVAFGSDPKGDESLLLNPISLAELKLKRTAVVTMITTADANDQKHKLNVQVTKVVSTALDTLTRSV